jgi:hypothetical protein
MFRLDRTAFTKQSLEKADCTKAYWLTKSCLERLQAAAYLNSVAYNFPPSQPPRLDKTHFEKRVRR